MDWKFYEDLAKQVKEDEEERNKWKKKEQIKNIHGDCDYVWAPDKSVATVIYVFVMIFGSIFNERILLWVVATLIYFNFIDKKQEE